jgi:hypothetical protein
MKKSILYLIFAMVFANLVFAQIKYTGVCNVDDMCSDEETRQNCPQDCLPGIQDDVCDGSADNICDPDCSSQADPDCEPSLSVLDYFKYRFYDKPISDLKSLREPMKSAYYIVIVGAVIAALSVILVAILLLVYLKRKIKEKRNQEQELI